MSKPNLECVNTTSDIKKEFVEKNFKDITIKKWTRNCPKCKEVIYHTTKCNRDRIVRLNMPCRKCAGINQRIYKTVIDFKRTCVGCGKILSYKSRKTFDVIRMNEIKNHLNCKFIRYNEKLNEIIEY